MAGRPLPHPRGLGPGPPRRGGGPALKAGLALLAACAALLAPAARADEIILGSGAKLEGAVQSPKCRRCAGSGRVACDRCGGKLRPCCPTCAGTEEMKCPNCEGLGTPAQKVRIKMRAGVQMEIDRKDVKRIVWKAYDAEKLLTARATYQKRLAALDQRDAKAHYELAKWCALAKLDAEALRHFRAAVKLDPEAYAKPVEPHVAELARRAERKAVKALLAALATFERAGADEGVRAIRRVRREFPDTEIVRRAELQRDLVRQHFPKLAAAWGDSLAALLRAAADRNAARCPSCAGGGLAACPACAGTAAGPCPDCKGSGERLCPVCRGTKRLTCPRCYGRGKLKGGTIGYGNRRCPDCGGSGELPCDFCRGSGEAACRACRGSGKRAGACPTCGGKGKVTCPDCGGSGLRQVREFTWGPPPVRKAGVVSVVGPGEKSRAWQGEYHGAVITAVPSGVLWRGALAGNLARLAGGRLPLVALAVDNRKGKKLLRFRPEKQTLRAVTAGAGQVRQADLAEALKARKDEPRARLVMAVAGRADCLPGAYLCVLAAFPEGTDLAGLKTLYWVPAGEGQPARLTVIWLDDDEVEGLRRSLK